MANNTAKLDSPNRSEAVEKLRLGLPLDTHEVAAISGAHPESVRRALRKGHLRGNRPVGLRDWRVTRDALAAWLRVPVAELVPSSN